MSSLVPVGPLSKPQHEPEVYATLMYRCFDLSQRIEFAILTGLIDDDLAKRFEAQQNELEQSYRRLTGENTQA